MTDPTPTCADVLREFGIALCWVAECPHPECTAERAIADEVLRLRTRWDAMIRRVEGLERYGADMRIRDDGALLSRFAVLAALREGGDA